MGMLIRAIMTDCGTDEHPPVTEDSWGRCPIGGQRQASNKDLGPRGRCAYAADSRERIAVAWRSGARPMASSRAKLSGRPHGDVGGRGARVGSLWPRAGSAVALRGSPLPATVRLYVLREWVEQSYKPRKNEGGWADTMG